MTPPSWQAVSHLDDSPLILLADGHIHATRNRAGSYDSTVKLWDLRCVYGFPVVFARVSH